MNSYDVASYDNRAVIELLKNESDSAFSDATHSIQLDSEDGHAYGIRGWARYAKGDAAGALEDCKRALEIFSVNLDSTDDEDRGMIYFINADYEKAVVSWEKSIKHDALAGICLQQWIKKAKAATKKTQ